MTNVYRNNKEEIKLRTMLRKKYGEEKVFVVANQDLPSMTEGFVWRSDDVLPILTNNGFFHDRWEVEYNPRLRQPIPYIILKHKDMYYGMERLKGAGEARLHNKITIGIGGHINPVDDDDSDEISNSTHMFSNALWRELREEITLPNIILHSEYKFVGLINDLSNEVSQDHLGLLYEFKLFNTSDIKVREVDKYAGRWYTLDELKENRDRLESWSQIALDVMLAGEVV